MNVRARFFALSAACAAGLIASGAQQASAAPVLPGDLVVFQQGNSTTAASTAGTPINLVEVNPVTGLAVQTFQPTGLFTDSSGSEGDLSLSAGGSLLTFSGFTTSSSSTETSVTTRGAGTLDALGNLSGPATTYSNATTKTQPRGAYTGDGTNFYMTDKSGIYYNYTGSPTSPSSPLNATNVRSIKNFGGATYVLQATTGAPIVSTVSPNSPTSSTSTVTLTGLAGLSTGDANAVDFTLVSSGNNGTAYDTLYYTNTAGIEKYALVSGSWTAEGTITATGLSGITARTDPLGGFDLYVAGTTTLEEITDSAAYNATANGGTPTTLYTAPNSGDILRGVSFAPVALPEPGSVGLLLLGAGFFVRCRRGAKA